RPERLYRLASIPTTIVEDHDHVGCRVDATDDGGCTRAGPVAGVIVPLDNSKMSLRRELERASVGGSIWRSQAGRCTSSELLQRGHLPIDLGRELRLTGRYQPLVVPCVDADWVAVGDDVTDKVGIAGGQPADEEERGVDMVSLERRK